jgi:hypothetical protein
MSGITLTNAIKTNIASYLTDVLLPDTVEGKLREQEGTADDLAGFAGVASAGLGAGTVLFALPQTWLSALAIGSFAAALGAFLADKAISPTAARLQTDNYYWYLVKRKIYCSLPATTDPADLTEAVRDRIARGIENIVPYNGADFGSKTSVNTIASGIIRSFSITEFRELLEAAATWVGNPNGTATLPNLPNGCDPNIALIPVIEDTGIIPFSERVSANTWLIGSTVSGVYTGAHLFPIRRIESAVIPSSSRLWVALFNNPTLCDLRELMEHSTM